MTQYESRSDLLVAKPLAEFIDKEVLPPIGLDNNIFWTRFAEIIHELSPENANLLTERNRMQAAIDEWNVANRDDFNLDLYKAFLDATGYLVEEGENFEIATENVDVEISDQPGPQLVVPAANARFAINAANARWGSLYNALYGTDVISDDGGAERQKHHNPIRAQKVVEFGCRFLDQHFELTSGSHSEVSRYFVKDNQLAAKLEAGPTTKLRNSEAFIGYQGLEKFPSAILMTHHSLRVIIEIDRNNSIGQVHKAGVMDITLESAITTIQDFEDSVVAVDAEDKVAVYKNWLGLMQGDIEESFTKNSQTVSRRLSKDRFFTAADGSDYVCHGRSLMLCRNVGHLMSSAMILDKYQNEVPEGIIDAMVSVAIAKRDLIGGNHLKNSRSGSIYVVKPKMHGPQEAAFTNRLMTLVEQSLELTKNTIKVGVMDEERRTTVNLKECIRQLKDRIMFINTGFLDRTGDEIHTSMLLGPMKTKSDIKLQKWRNAYEKWNVDIGLECGFGGRAQIGKGMWARPDDMADMLNTKIEHIKQGASTAWVPSPTAAILHALHYHQLNVIEQQKEIAKRDRVSINDILTVPIVAADDIPSIKEIERELDNNIQGILGYVVRWVDQGVGASKVPDIDNTGLMEDRATLRISSQHICNWLVHKIVSQAQVKESFRRMAKVVDAQNKDDASYQPMSVNLGGSLAYQAALALVFEAKDQPNGYTEPLLHEFRLAAKNRNS